MRPLRPSCETLSNAFDISKNKLVTSVPLPANCKFN